MNLVDPYGVCPKSGYTTDDPLLNFFNSLFGYDNWVNFWDTGDPGELGWAIAKELGLFGGGITIGKIIGNVIGNTLDDFYKQKGLENPFKGKTPEEIDKMFKDKGFDTRGPDPKGGLGGYVNPKTGRSYHIDECNSYKEPPHVDVNRLKKYPKLKKKRYFTGE